MSKAPSQNPTHKPTSKVPTAFTTSVPTSLKLVPSTSPTKSEHPTIQPSKTAKPTKSTSTSHTGTPTETTTISPTYFETIIPSFRNTKAPVYLPTKKSSFSPSIVTSISPSNNPTPNPTIHRVSAKPTFKPSNVPIATPTNSPSKFLPTLKPSNAPTAIPTNSPSKSNPTLKPSPAPTVVNTVSPSQQKPTSSPSGKKPSFRPSKTPIAAPTPLPLADPTAEPIYFPTVDPTAEPIISKTAKPTFRKPTPKTTLRPSVTPSNPSTEPSSEGEEATPPIFNPTFQPLPFPPTIRPDAPTFKPIPFTGKIGYFSTREGQIVDQYGNNIRITGINWYGFETSSFCPGGLNVRTYRSILLQMKEIGFNAFRIPWSDEMLLPASAPLAIDYSINPDLAGLSPVEVLDKIVEYCGEIGMRIILDRHSCQANGSPKEPYWYIPGDPYYTEAQVRADWVMMAQRYAGNPTVIGMDLWNEPKGNTLWTEWFLAAERIGNAILAVNPKLLIIVEGTGENFVWWGSNLYGAIANPVVLTYPDQLLYSAHDYGTSVFPQLYLNLNDTNFPHDLKDIWTPYWAYLFIDNPNPRPVFVGEFGDPLTKKVNQVWMKTLLDFMNGDYYLNGVNQLLPGQKGVSWTYWTINPGGDTTGILQNDWLTVDPVKLEYIGPSLAPLLLT